jgi:hypothetical protein
MAIKPAIETDNRGTDKAFLFKGVPHLKPNSRTLVSSFTQNGIFRCKGARRSFRSAGSVPVLAFPLLDREECNCLKHTNVSVNFSSISRRGVGSERRVSTVSTIWL